MPKKKPRPTIEEQRAKERAIDELMKEHLEAHRKLMEIERQKMIEEAIIKREEERRRYREQMGTIPVTKPARSNKGSFKRAIEYEMDQMQEDWERDKDWMWDDTFTYPLTDQCPQCGLDEHCVCAAEDGCVQCGKDVDLCECTEEIPRRRHSTESFQSMLKTVYKDMIKDLLGRDF